MDIKQLQYFLELCKSNNISLAADKLFISQQGLSAAVKKMESELGVQLFTRTKKGTTPNEFALELLPYANSVLCDYNNMLEYIDDFKSSISGHINVYADRMLLDYLPHGTESRQHELFPNLDYNIIDTYDKDAMAHVLSGDGELAMISGPVDSKLFDFEVLFKYKYVAVVNKNNRLFKNDHINIDDLAGEEITIVSEKSNMYDNFIKRCQIHDIEPKVAFFSANSQHLAYLCSVEPIVGITTEFYSAMIPEKNVHILPIIENDFFWDILIVNKREHSLTLAAKTWKDYIIKVAASMDTMSLDMIV